jgi:hypothetical protein
MVVRSRSLPWTSVPIQRALKISSPSSGAAHPPDLLGLVVDQHQGRVLRSDEMVGERVADGLAGNAGSFLWIRPGKAFARPGERSSPDLDNFAAQTTVGLSGNVARGWIWRSSSSSSPRASISATTAKTAAWSFRQPVRTVSPRFNSGSIEGNADNAVAPSCPLILIL